MFGFGTRVGLDEGMEVDVRSEKLSFVVLLRIRTWDKKGTERGGGEQVVQSDMIKT